MADPGAAERRQQAEAIREKIKTGHRQYAHEAKIAAAELWKIFEERGPDFKRRVCEVVWGVKQQKPTKNLYGLVWDPKVGVPKGSTRSPQALTIYLRLAEAVSKVAGEDEDSVILRVFPSLLDGVGSFAVRDIGPAEQLRETFWNEWLEANERIAADCDLRRAFPVAMELPGNSFGPYPRFPLEHGQVLGGEDSSFLEYDRRWVSYQRSGSPRDFLLGMAPAVFLGECHGPSFRAQVALIDDQGQPGEVTPPLTTWVRVWLRFWWAILPIGTDGSPRGCFVVSLVTQCPSSLWTVADLDQAHERDRDEQEEYNPRQIAPWARFLSASGKRGLYNSYYWTKGPLLDNGNSHGIVLSWDCEETGGLLQPGVPPGHYRCTAEMDAGTREVLTQVFDRAPEDLPPTPARVLPASAYWRDVIFNLPDGALADWVGPDPDVPHTPRPPHKLIRPDMSKEERDQIEFENIEAWEARREDEIAYQQRGLVSVSRDPDDITIFPDIRVGKSSYRGTIGRKFVDSLLHLPEADRPDMNLLQQAEELRDHARDTLGQITGKLRKKMTTFGRRTP